MPEQTNDSPGLGALLARLERGELTRRGFVRRAVALGCSASAIAGFLAACGGSSPTATSAAVPTSAPTAAATSAATSAAVSPTAAATTAATPAGGGAITPIATPGRAASPAAGASPAGSPAATGGGHVLGAPTTHVLGAAGGWGPGPSKRGAAGTLKVLYWQAPTTLNPHFGTGPKDQDAGRLVLEPLADFGPDDSLIPWLAAEIPTRENGGVAADGMSVTWKLKPDITWSDGQPFTAADCVFTWQFASNKETAAITYGNYSAVDKVEALDDHTVKITFKQPTPAWYIPLTDAILPQHIFKDAIGSKAKNFNGNLKPIGTGPYVVDSFAPGDSIAFSANPKFRDPNGPAFDKVQWKGGGDAVSAARAVFQTGDYQVAANLQVEPAILDQIVKQSGGKAQLGFEPGHGVEQVLFNFTDPNKEVDGQRSHLGTPHPFLSDPQVRKAFNLLADRKTISDVLYGQSGEPWALLQSVPESALPQGDTWAFNIAQASAMLDAAGWTKQGQYRAKNGVPMKVLLVATTNSVRQKEQQILKDAFEKAGVQTELKSVDAGVYFSTDPGNDNTFQKFYSDMEMTTYPVGSPDPQRFLSFLTTAEIPQKENNWNGNNAWRYSNPQFDKLNAESKTELDPAKRDDLFRQQYQLLYDDAVGIPLVARKEVFGYATGIDNTFGQPWAGLTWNIANWTKK